MVKVAQDASEFDKFCKLMIAEHVRSYLEIGSWKGGSIRIAAKSLPKGSRIVSVDDMGRPKLQMVLNELRQAGYDVHLILGDSIDPKTVAAARALGPYDAVFIDGDHALNYVTSDWKHYGSIGRIIGFHDIARDLPAKGRFGPCQVSSFWNQLDKTRYRTEEIISDMTRMRTDDKVVYGIGVVWR